MSLVKPFMHRCHVTFSLGFTLLELLLVMAVIGLLTALAIPTAEHAAARTTAREQLSAMCRLARAEAIASGEINGLVWIISDPPYRAHRFTTTSAELTAEGYRLLTPRSRWQQLPEPFQFLRADDHEETMQLPDGTEVSAVLFAPSGKRLAAMDPTTAALAIAPVRTRKDRHPTPNAAVERLVIHPSLGTCTWTNQQ